MTYLHWAEWGMAEAESGEYVGRADYEVLRQEKAAIAKERDQLQAMLDLSEALRRKQGQAVADAMNPLLRRQA